MSSSELADLAAQLEHQVNDLVTKVDGPLEVSPESVRAIVTAAARLYARYGETVGPIDPLREEASPTEAVDLACGLLRARDLNPFDLALWFSRPA
ncbi:hypothetical protein [Amycolatopsis taiwanensis]|uniref:hypothetical protein n=1 Tax=Amycolatopsis taiwanensis TaxID=342230 RepID=UPI000489F732|nr:hypothetical protein [Amycolatopsis taiwanensis]